MGSRNLEQISNYTYNRVREYILNKPIASAATVLFLLELDEFQFSKWLEDILQVTFSNAKMDVADVEPVERYRIRITTACIWIARLAIFLCLRKLSDDGNP